MKQPYLGKKVLKLRKAKGLTQTELVEKCGITIRTLQRIESGEVTPRAYTIKAISEVLDFDFFDSLNTNKLVRESNNMLYRLEQVYKYIIDLFNLKINTMRKLKILSIPVILICIVLMTVSYNANAQRRIHKKLIGTWQVVKIDNTENQTQEKFIDWISFEKEGTVQLGNHVTTKSGTWTYNESKSSIVIKIEKNPMTEFNITEFSKKNLTMENKENIMYLEKNK
ncbi:helix-turn-helix domain-containing protein [Saccharicrinis sp. FJH62]|uniref:helix-turn-helix domain-containing protein n=1 Tax=Saccharicrinis sp. FJH62 TaxID=3344657 RepID=UPI0035D48163